MLKRLTFAKCCDILDTLFSKGVRQMFKSFNYGTIKHIGNEPLPVDFT